MELEINETFNQLAEFIVDGKLLGTSATASIGEVEIDGQIFQVQMRFEKNKNDFIHPAQVVSSSILSEHYV